MSALQQCAVAAAHHPHGFVDQALGLSAFGRAFPGCAAKRFKTRIDECERNFAAGGLGLVSVDQVQQERQSSALKRGRAKLGRQITIGATAQVSLKGPGCSHTNGEALVNWNDKGDGSAHAIVAQPQAVFNVVIGNDDIPTI